MSLIISFPLHRVVPAAASKGREAEVVIFPGVRIERQELTPAGKALPAKLRHGATAPAPERDLG